MSLLDRLHRAPTPDADVPADQTAVTPRQRPVLLPHVPEWVRRAQQHELPVKVFVP